MGQQQLLLVILVTIIVGIATVVAINTFGAAADSANVDAVRQDVASIAAAAQGHYMKPTMLGGGNRTFDNLSFEGLAVPGTVSGGGLTLTNDNGTYVLSDIGGSSVTITATPVSAADNENIDALTATIEANGFSFNS